MAQQSKAHLVNISRVWDLRLAHQQPTHEGQDVQSTVTQLICVQISTQKPSQIEKNELCKVSSLTNLFVIDMLQGAFHFQDAKLQS